MSQPESKERFMTQGEAAKYAGVHIRTIQRWIKKGLLRKDDYTKQALDFAKRVEPHYKLVFTVIEAQDFLKEVTKAIQLFSDVKERIESKLARLKSATSTGQQSQ